MGKLLANLKKKQNKKTGQLNIADRYLKRNKHSSSSYVPSHDTCMCPVVHLTCQQKGMAPKSSFHGCFESILFIKVHQSPQNSQHTVDNKTSKAEFFFTFLRPNSSNSRKRSVSLPTFSGTVMKVSDRRESGPAPGSSSARARGSLLKSIKFASFGLLPGSHTERCSFSKRSAMSVPTTVLTTKETKQLS